MSFETIKLPRRLVGAPARYRVDAEGRKVMLIVREDTGIAAGYEIGTWVELLVGKEEHRNQFALRKVPGEGSHESRRFRKTGAALGVEFPYLRELKRLMPRPKNPEVDGHTVPLEMVDVSEKGVVIFRMEGAPKR